MSDILTEIMKKNMDLVLLHILSLLGGGSLHRCRQVCKSWNRYIIDVVWGTKVGRDKVKKQLKWCWENVTPTSSVVGFWDEMDMENWSLAIDNDFIVFGPSCFAENGANVIERSSGVVLETLKVEASLLPLHASTLPVSHANLRYEEVFMVKIGPQHIVTAANFSDSTGEVDQYYVIISIWRKDNFELVKIVWDYSVLPQRYYNENKLDLSQGFLIYQSFTGKPTDCICINFCNDDARISLRHNYKTNHAAQLGYIKIFHENVLTAVLLGSYLFIQVNIWSPSTGQCLSSKEITLTNVECSGFFTKPTFSFFNPHLLFGIGIEGYTSRILLQMWDVDIGNNRVVQDINIVGFQKLHLVNIDEHFIYSIIGDGDGVKRLNMWRTEELKDLTVTKQDIRQRSVDIEIVPEGHDLAGVVIDHKSIVSVSNSGSTICIRNLDFWH